MSLQTQYLKAVSKHKWSSATFNKLLYKVFFSMKSNQMEEQSLDLQPETTFWQTETACDLISSAQNTVLRTSFVEV